MVNGLVSSASVLSTARYELDLDMLLRRTSEVGDSVCTRNWVLYAFRFNLYCGGFMLFCNVCVCEGFVMCGCFGKCILYSD